MKAIVLAAAAAILMTIAPAAAQQVYPNPYKVGDFWTVDEYHVKPGGGLKLANDIANDWQKRQEFARSKGWIKSFMILQNPYPRENEPTILLISVTDRLPTPDEVDARGVEMRAYLKKSGDQLQTMSANRAEYSTPGSLELFRQWVKR